MKEKKKINKFDLSKLNRSYVEADNDLVEDDDKQTNMRLQKMEKGYGCHMGGTTDSEESGEGDNEEESDIRIKMSASEGLIKMRRHN